MNWVKSHTHSIFFMPFWENITAPPYCQCCLTNERWLNVCCALEHPVHKGSGAPSAQHTFNRVSWRYLVVILWWNLVQRIWYFKQKSCDVCPRAASITGRRLEGEGALEPGGAQQGITYVRGSRGPRLAWMWFPRLSAVKRSLIVSCWTLKAWNHPQP